ncbi:MAG: hypothetical protein ACC662_02385 [Planctomycetota bacterium]
MARPRSEVPEALVEAGRRFERWRRERTSRRRTPDELWALATQLGGEYGVAPTARALGVHAHTLKKRVEAARRAERGALASSAAFVEILPVPQTPTWPEGCRVVLERASGEKMVMHLREASPTVPLGLARLFLGRRR